MLSPLEKACIVCQGPSKAIPPARIINFVMTEVARFYGRSQLFGVLTLSSKGQRFFLLVDDAHQFFCDISSLIFNQEIHHVETFSGKGHRNGRASILLPGAAAIRANL